VKDHPFKRKSEEKYMLIQSDFHIHSEYSCDASLPIERIAEGALACGFERIGITDHMNDNTISSLSDVHRSAAAVGAAREKYPFMLLGVELTPIEKPEFDYIAKTGTREGYVAPTQSAPFDIELAMTKEEMMSLGIRYAIGASHWRVDVPGGKGLHTDRDVCIKEWYRQQMWLACDERVTVLGHPWWIWEPLWHDDFSVIPHSMNLDIIAALKENGKYVECNSGMFMDDNSERFRVQYAEFLRECFEMGVPVTYGSDSHTQYNNGHIETEKYLRAAGFCDGDISEIAEKDLW
jgi:histidinol phosphatase-like PHP family hydrolase